MKVVILAAGRGSSLGTFTSEAPKCMLPIGDETIIQRQIRTLKECGIEPKDIILVAGYKYECIRVDNEVEIIINTEYNSTNNAYSLLLALNKINEDILVLDSDLIFAHANIEKLKQCETNTLLAINQSTGYGKTGIVIDENGKVKEIGKHLTTSITYASMMKISKDSLSALKYELNKESNKRCWYTIPIAKLLGEICFQVAFSESYLYEVNTFTDYLEIKRKLGIDVNSILVTGASGFLGKKIYHVLKRNYNVVGIKGHSNKDAEFTAINLTNFDEIDAYIALTKPNLIIHTAGIAEPEKCMNDKNDAEKINVEAVKKLVQICQKRNIKLIHISTDYVFEGNKEEPYKKTDIRNPKNFYGETKKKAEDIVLEYKNSLIVRVPILYGYNDESDKKTFPITILEKLKKGEKIKADNLQIRYPVLIDEVAFSVADCMHKKGIIHISSGEGITKYRWAKTIAQEFGYDESLIQSVNGNVEDRPIHVCLDLGDEDYLLSNIREGTRILKKQLYCSFKLIYKSTANMNIYNKNVGNYRYQLGKCLGRSLPKNIIEKIDYIVPVPTSGLYYAMGLAEEINVPYLQALVKPDYKTRSFQLSDVSLREKVIQDKIYAIPEMLEGKSIALVDEAIFTGITLRVVCDMVRACGVKDIYICIPTPMCKNSCRQYVQPERKLLIEQMEDQDIKGYFKVEGVFFQEHDLFEKSIEDVENICYECFRR